MQESHLTTIDERVMHAIYTTFAVIPWAWLALHVTTLTTEKFAETTPTWIHIPLYLGLMISLGSVPVWLAFTAWRHIAIPAQRERRLTLLAYIVGIALMVGTLAFQPFGS